MAKKAKIVVEGLTKVLASVPKRNIVQPVVMDDAHWYIEGFHRGFLYIPISDDPVHKLFKVGHRAGYIARCVFEKTKSTYTTQPKRSQSKPKPPARKTVKKKPIAKRRR